MVQDYTQMADEQLAELAQSGDDDAFTTLFKRYERALQMHARNAALRFPSYYQDEFFGYFQERFIKIVQKFDIESGVYFAKYCQYKFPKLAHDYIRGQLQKRSYTRLENGKYKRENVDEPTIRDQHKAITSDLEKTDTTDNRFTYDFQKGIEDTDLFAYLKDRSEVNAKVVSLLASGYTYEEVGEMMGKTGTTDAKKGWTNYIMRKVRQDAIDFYRSCDSEGEIRTLANLG
jgi:DNA-directed RNA polymerase specialized sigma24 family protein